MCFHFWTLIQFKTNHFLALTTLPLAKKKKIKPHPSDSREEIWQTSSVCEGIQNFAHFGFENSKKEIKWDIKNVPFNNMNKHTRHFGIWESGIGSRHLAIDYRIYKDLQYCWVIYAVLCIHMCGPNRFILSIEVDCIIVPLIWCYHEHEWALYACNRIWREKKEEINSTNNTGPQQEYMYNEEVDVKWNKIKRKWMWTKHKPSNQPISTRLYMRNTKRHDTTECNHQEAKYWLHVENVKQWKVTKKQNNLFFNSFNNSSWT